VPLVDLRQARQEIRLGWVRGLLGWRPRECRGEQVRGACVLHGSTAPRSRSFAAHLGRGVWHCFRCGASGNALELWARATGQGLYRAVLDLYDRLGREVPWLQPARPATLAREKTDVIDRSSG
jgi:DNA primase